MRPRLHLTIVRSPAHPRSATPRGLTLSRMALRMHPVSASRWAQLAATRLPIDLTDEPTVADDLGTDPAGSTPSIALIQAYVDALDPRRARRAR